MTRYCRLAKAGKKLILSEDWFMLCYDERLRKPEDPKAGLFRNKAGIKVVFSPGKRFIARASLILTLVL